MKPWVYDEKVIMDRTDIKEGTKQSYVYAMRRLNKLDTSKPLTWFMTHPNSAHKLMTSKITVTKTLLSTMCGFMAYMRYLDIPKQHTEVYEAWKAIYLPYLLRQNVRDGSNEPTKKQTKARVEWEHVLKVRKGLQSDEYGGREHLLLCVYSYMPPRRQLDYHRVHILRKAATDQEKKLLPAYIDFSEKPVVIVVNQFKTARENRYWEKEIPADLLKAIKASLKMLPRKYLFVQRDGAPFKNANSFQKNSNSILKKIFNNSNVSVNSLRHSFRTFRSKKHLTVNELKEDAHDLGHSLETSLKYTFIDRRMKL